jgi:hypothetical protein
LNLRCLNVNDIPAFPVFSAVRPDRRHAFAKVERAGGFLSIDVSKVKARRDPLERMRTSRVKKGIERHAA